MLKTLLEDLMEEPFVDDAHESNYQLERQQEGMVEVEVADHVGAVHEAEKTVVMNVGTEVISHEIVVAVDAADPAAVQEAEAVIIEPAHEATLARRNAPQRAQNALEPHVAVIRAVSLSHRECVTFHAANPSRWIVQSLVRLTIEAQVAIRALTRVTATIKAHSLDSLDMITAS